LGVAIALSESEQERYSAQIDELGLEGQLELKRSRAIVIGAGASGSAAAAELASRGVGYVAVVDGGNVGLRDLAGQAIYYTPDVGQGRADTLAGKLGLLNPEVQVESYPVDLDAGNASAIVEGHDVVLMCTNDPGASEAVDAACLAADLPVSHIADPGPSAVASGTSIAAQAVALLAGAASEPSR
jgi:adenylyltransferase/sulfurtransferase